MKIRIIDYKAGNSGSVLHAVEHLRFEAKCVKSPAGLEGATHIILPGVGTARATIDNLRELGFIDALCEAVLEKKTPFLGICIGLQLLFERSEEEDTPCLGWLKGEVKRFDASAVRVPQMGWNYVSFTKSSPVKAKDGHYYFVNSYHAEPAVADDLWAVSDYGGKFTAAVWHENIFATQFHAEKSGQLGLELLKGFLSL